MVNGRAMAPILSDFNNDGLVDVFIPNGDGQANHLFQNIGDFQFKQIKDSPVTSSRSNTVGAAWGDYDNDGDLDLAVLGDDGSTNPTATIYRYDGNDTFVSVTTLSTNAGLESASEWGDYNGDGLLDLFVAGNGVATLFRNEGGGAFTEASNDLAGVTNGASADWGDYGKDGDLDLIVTGDDGSAPTATIYRNEGGAFSAVSSGLTGVKLGSSDWGDFDGDGALDLTLSGLTSQNDNYASIYRNDGGGTFSALTSELQNVDDGSSTNWADFDGDGDLDLFVGEADGTLNFFRNEGTPQEPQFTLGSTVIRHRSTRPPGPPYGLRMTQPWSGRHPSRTVPPRQDRSTTTALRVSVRTPSKVLIQTRHPIPRSWSRIGQWNRSK